MNPMSRNQCFIIYLRDKTDTMGMSNDSHITMIIMNKQEANRPSNNSNREETLLICSLIVFIYSVHIENTSF